MERDWPALWSLEAWMTEQAEQAGCVISAVGSLSVHIAVADSKGAVSR